MPPDQRGSNKARTRTPRGINWRCPASLFAEYTGPKTDGRERKWSIGEAIRSELDAAAASKVNAICKRIAGEIGSSWTNVRRRWEKQRTPVRVLFEGSNPKSIAREVRNTKWGCSLKPKHVSSREVELCVLPMILPTVERFAALSREVYLCYLPSPKPTDPPRIVRGAQYAKRQKERAQATPGRTPLAVWPSEMAHK